MGMLVTGVWHQEDPPMAGGDGSFVRPESGFRDRVTRDGSSGFKAEAGRYVLVAAPSCPWAHRTVLMRRFKGLEDAIEILQSDFPKGQGWAYSRGLDDLRPIDGIFHVHQVYSAARPDFTGRATEESFHKLFGALDQIELRLDHQRYLVGDRFTEADLRLFPTLVRFDAVYYNHFKCNLRRIADYHNLSNYLREIYQMPGIAETVDMPGIKLGYYGGMRNLNPGGIIPLGPELDFAAPHDRERFAGGA